MIVNLPPDPVAEAVKTIEACGEKIAACLQENLTRIVDAGAKVNPVFWSDPRIGTNGAALLAKLSAFVGILAANFPERMNATLTSAGQNLTANPDGTVTYTPPDPEPELEPAPEGGE